MNDDEKSAYEILGLKPNASLEEIKTAYKRMIRLYHPDKVASMALEFQELAELRTKEINLAYAALTNRRGTTKAQNIKTQPGPHRASDDELYIKSVRLVTELGKASIYILASKLSIDSALAKKLLYRMKRERLVRPIDDYKPWQVLPEAYEYIKRRFSQDENN